jgi:hypothetical protein
LAHRNAIHSRFTRRYFFFAACFGEFLDFAGNLAITGELGQPIEVDQLLPGVTLCESSAHGALDSANRFKPEAGRPINLKMRSTSSSVNSSRLLSLS